MANYSTSQDLLPGRMMSWAGWVGRVRSNKGKYVIHVCNHTHATPAEASQCARDWVAAYDRVNQRSKQS